MDTTQNENVETCPGCGCTPGDGRTYGCVHPDGCGYGKKTRGVIEAKAKIKAQVKDIEDALLDDVRKSSVMAELKPDVNAFLWQHLPGRCSLAVADKLACDITDMIEQEWNRAEAKAAGVYNGE